MKERQEAERGERKRTLSVKCSTTRVRPVAAMMRTASPESHAYARAGGTFCWGRRRRNISMSIVSGHKVIHVQML